MFNDIDCTTIFNEQFNDVLNATVCAVESAAVSVCAIGSAAVSFCAIDLLQKFSCAAG